MPLYSTDALVLRTYKLGEADRIVVFLTRDRGKKRGVAQSARRPRSRFMGALEPLTEVRVAYFEKEQRELVNLNYAESVRSPLATPNPDALGYSAYFAELLDASAADADPDERLYRLGTATLEALTAGGPVEPLARYFECWLLRLQGVYPPDVACGQCGVDFGSDDGAFLGGEGHGFVCRGCHGAQAPTTGSSRPAPWPSFAPPAGSVRSTLRRSVPRPRSCASSRWPTGRSSARTSNRTLKSVRVVQDLTRPRL